MDRKGLTNEDVRALTSKAEGLNDEEKAVIIKSFPDELLYEELGRRIAELKDMRNKFAALGKEFGI